MHVAHCVVYYRPAVGMLAALCGRDRRARPRGVLPAQAQDKPKTTFNRVVATVTTRPTPNLKPRRSTPRSSPRSTSPSNTTTAPQQHHYEQQPQLASRHSSNRTAPTPPMAMPCSGAPPPNGSPHYAPTPNQQHGCRNIGSCQHQQGRRATVEGVWCVVCGLARGQCVV